jgi:hypothetical protein
MGDPFLKEAERFESAFNRWLADSGAAFYPAGDDPDSDDYVAMDFSTFLAIVRAANVREPRAAILQAERWCVGAREMTGRKISAPRFRGRVR